jgi:hypothetical protein
VHFNTTRLEQRLRWGDATRVIVSRHTLAVYSIQHLSREVPMLTCVDKVISLTGSLLYQADLSSH